jgi:7,8-dihydro-6-hydroxymethylpterin-pyrophosphokinase
MNDEKKIKLDIQKEIGDLARIIGLLSEKYKDDPLLNDAQSAFMNLAVHVGKALDIQLQ